MTEKKTMTCNMKNINKRFEEQNNNSREKVHGAPR